MPQMAPLYWTLLFMLFTSILIFMVIMNYFMFMYTPPKKMKLMKKIKFNWKW